MTIQTSIDIRIDRRIDVMHTHPMTVNVNTPATLPSVAKPPMVMRSIRVPVKLWEAAKAAADEREENISDVLREALERYVGRKP